MAPSAEELRAEEGDILVRLGSGARPTEFFEVAGLEETPVVRREIRIGHLTLRPRVERQVKTVRVHPFNPGVGREKKTRTVNANKDVWSDIVPRGNRIDFRDKT